jgi:hypothetical protein
MIDVPYLDQDAVPVRGEPEPHSLRTRRLPGFALLIGDQGNCAYRVGDHLGDKQFCCIDELDQVARRFAPAPVPVTVAAEDLLIDR